MKVVLVFPSSNFRASSPTSAAGLEHLGLGYIASYLRQCRHEVETLNFHLELAFSTNLQTPESVTEKILSCVPDIIGMSITGSTINDALAVAYQIKAIKPSIHICWGSHHVATYAQDILKNEPCIDTIMAGDGEISWQKLLTALEQGDSLSSVPGIWYRDNGQVLLSGKFPEPDLNTLPFPARDTLEELVRRGMKVSDARISTSRGCPYSCRFCVDPVLGYEERWRARNASSIIDEIKYLVQTYNISHFWFSDDNFLLPTSASRQRAIDIANRLVEEKLNITYRVLMRADAVAKNEEIIGILAQSGLVCIYMGLEAASPRRLKYFDKQANLDIYCQATKLVRKYKIGLQIGVIMFDPLTSWTDLKLDAQFLHDIEEMYLYSNYCQTLFVYPGTLIVKDLEDKGLLPKGFNYRSEYLSYTYEEPQVGKLAESINSAYSKEWVEMDDFFRRLRMVDIPALSQIFGRSHTWVDDLNKEVETRIANLNQKGFNFFMNALALSQEEKLAEIPSLIESHYKSSLNLMNDLVRTLMFFPKDVRQHLSALNYVDEPTINR
jgi:radical SAM superfamily enzyme YgiQ (UPF0313 family)